MNNPNAGNSSNPRTVINNYHYHNGGRGRGRGRGRVKGRGNGRNNTNTQTEDTKHHIIFTSKSDPSTMKIIPYDKNTNPYLFSPDFIKHFINKDKSDDKKDDKTKDDKINDGTKDEKKDEKNEDEYVILDKIESIDDLIKLGESYNVSDKRKYPINMLRLKNITNALKELQNVIGMTSVKKNMFEQLLFLLQELNDDNMMHTVIEGPPGVGKTLLGRILAKIYCKLNFLKKNEKNEEENELHEITNNLLSLLNPNLAKKEKDKKELEKKEEKDYKFKVVRRSDLIGQYVGSTAIKTQKIIDESFGGVLFIDEVYSLGSANERSDTFAKEAIDTLNQNLSENGDKFVCIIAGYPLEIERCFFSQNEGLKRRFPFKYTIEKYDANELANILQFKIKEINWNFDESLNVKNIEEFIEKHKKNFENYGGDIDNLLLNMKIKHSTRVFGKDPKIRKNISFEDLTNAYEEFVKMKKDKELPQYVKDMYA